MNKNDLQECINECEQALVHLNHAINKVQVHPKQKMQHAVKDLEECIQECRNLM